MDTLLNEQPAMPWIVGWLMCLPDGLFSYETHPLPNRIYLQAK